MDLARQLEAVLFYKSEPVEAAALARLLNVSEEELRAAANRLGETLAERGIRLLDTGTAYALTTAPENHGLIEHLKKEELSADLGRAGLETLTIVLYRGEATRAEIDYIRGVNSSFIVRHLLIRGLVERQTNPADARSFIYRPTAELLAHLGLTSVANLPDFETIRSELINFMNTKETSSPAVTEPDII